MLATVLSVGTYYILPAYSNVRPEVNQMSSLQFCACACKFACITLLQERGKPVYSGSHSSLRDEIVYSPADGRGIKGKSDEM